MVGAVSEVTQDPEKAGSAMKILSLRLRGMKGEVEEIEAGAGEGVESVSKMQTQILNLTKGKVNIFEDDGSFKSTYDIMKGIAEVWDELSSVEQADLLETIAGKNRANDVSALITNFATAEQMYMSALNSEGSMLEEHAVHMDSLQGKIDVLKASAQDFVTTFVSSDFASFAIESLTKLLDLLTLLVENAGILGTVFGGAALLGGAKNILAVSKAADGLNKSLAQTAAMGGSKGFLSGLFSVKGLGVMGVIGAISLITSQITKHKKELEEARQETMDENNEFLDSYNSFEQIYAKYGSKNYLTADEEAEVKAAIDATTDALGYKSNALTAAAAAVDNYAVSLDRLARLEAEQAQLSSKENVQLAEYTLEDAAMSGSDLVSSVLPYELQVTSLMVGTPIEDIFDTASFGLKDNKEKKEASADSVGDEKDNYESHLAIEIITKDENGQFEDHFVTKEKGLLETTDLYSVRPKADENGDVDAQEVLDYYLWLDDKYNQLLKKDLEGTEEAEKLLKDKGKVEAAAQDLLKQRYELAKSTWELEENAGKAPVSQEEYIEMMDWVFEEDGGGLGVLGETAKGFIASYGDEDFSEIFNFSYEQYLLATEEAASTFAEAVEDAGVDLYDVMVKDTKVQSAFDLLQRYNTPSANTLNTRDDLFPTEEFTLRTPDFLVDRTEFGLENQAEYGIVSTAEETADAIEEEVSTASKIVNGALETVGKTDENFNADAAKMAAEKAGKTMSELPGYLYESANKGGEKSSKKAKNFFGKLEEDVNKAGAEIKDAASKLPGDVADTIEESFEFNKRVATDASLGDKAEYFGEVANFSFADSVISYIFRDNFDGRALISNVPDIQLENEKQREEIAKAVDEESQKNKDFAEKILRESGGELTLSGAISVQSGKNDSKKKSADKAVTDGLVDLTVPNISRSSIDGATEESAKEFADNVNESFVTSVSRESINTNELYKQIENERDNQILEAKKYLSQRIYREPNRLGRHRVINELGEYEWREEYYNPYDDIYYFEEKYDSIEDKQVKLDYAKSNFDRLESDIEDAYNKELRNQISDAYNAMREDYVDKLYDAAVEEFEDNQMDEYWDDFHISDLLPWNFAKDLVEGIGESVTEGNGIDFSRHDFYLEAENQIRDLQKHDAARYQKKMIKYGEGNLAVDDNGEFKLSENAYNAVTEKVSATQEIVDNLSVYIESLTNELYNETGRNYYPDTEETDFINEDAQKLIREYGGPLTYPYKGKGINFLEELEKNQKAKELEVDLSKYVPSFVAKKPEGDEYKNIDDAVESNEEQREEVSNTINEENQKQINFVEECNNKAKSEDLSSDLTIGTSAFSVKQDDANVSKDIADAGQKQRNEVAKAIDKENKKMEGFSEENSFLGYNLNTGESIVMQGNIGNDVVFKEDYAFVPIDNELFPNAPDWMSEEEKDKIIAEYDVNGALYNKFMTESEQWYQGTRRIRDMMVDLDSFGTISQEDLQYLTRAYGEDLKKLGYDTDKFTQSSEELDDALVDLNKEMDAKQIKRFDDALTQIDFESLNVENARASVENLMSTVGSFGNLSSFITIQTDMTSVREGIELYNSAIAESLSGQGLTDETINNIKTRYSSLIGYDESKLFDRTTHGIELNTQTVAEYEKQLADFDNGKYLLKLEALQNEYDETYKKLAASKDQSSIDTFQAELTNIQAEIDEVNALASAYSGATSEYQQWLNAREGGDNRDKLENTWDGIKEANEELGNGWADRGTRELMEFITGRNYTTDRGGKKGKATFTEVYDDFSKLDDKTIGGGQFSIMDMYTTDDDGNITSEGYYNFLDAIIADQKQFNQEWVKVNKDGSYKINFDAAGKEDLAELWGVSGEYIDMMLEAGKDIEDTFDFSSIFEDTNEILTYGQRANKELNELYESSGGTKGTAEKFNFATENVETATAEMEKASEWFTETYVKDGQINFSVEGASEAYNVISALIARKQELEKPAVFKVVTDTSQVVDAYQDEYGVMSSYYSSMQQAEAADMLGNAEEAQKFRDEAYFYMTEMLNWSPETKEVFGLPEIPEGSDVEEWRKEYREAIMSGEGIEVPLKVELGATTNNILLELLNQFSENKFVIDVDGNLIEFTPEQFDAYQKKLQEGASQQEAIEFATKLGEPEPEETEDGTGENGTSTSITPKGVTLHEEGRVGPQKADLTNVYGYNPEPEEEPSLSQRSNRVTRLGYAEDTSEWQESQNRLEVESATIAVGKTVNESGSTRLGGSREDEVTSDILGKGASLVGKGVDWLVDLFTVDQAAAAEITPEVDPSKVTTTADVTVETNTTVNDTSQQTTEDTVQNNNQPISKNTTVNANTNTNVNDTSQSDTEGEVDANNQPINTEKTVNVSTKVVPVGQSITSKIDGILNSGGNSTGGATTVTTNANVDANVTGQGQVDKLNTSIGDVNNKTVNVTANIIGLNNVQNLKNMLNSLPTSKTITITTNRVNNNVKGNGGGAKASGSAHVGGSAFAGGAVGRAFKSGDWRVGGSGGVALGGELGQEIVVRDGHYFTIGDNSAEFFNYKPGDIIFNAEQTKQIFNSGKITSGSKRGKAYAGGTASSSGRAFEDKPVVIYSSTTGTSSHKPSYNDPLNLGGNNNSNSNNNNNNNNKDGNKNNNKETKDDFKEVFDWIEVAIDRIERLIERLSKTADNVYKTWAQRSKAITQSINQTRKEIDLQWQGYNRYIKEANKVTISKDKKTDAKYKKLVQNGKIDIETIKNEKLAEKIKEYQEW